VKQRIVGIAVLLCTTSVWAQEDLVPVKIRAILVDKDLNPKPVPKLVVNLQAVQSQPHSLTTGFDGLAEAQLPRGRYHLTTPQPVEFQGKKYSWDLDWELAQPESHLDLSIDNAKVAAIEPMRVSAADNLGEQFQRLKNSVVTVWSEFGHGTGFFADSAGIILTNLHVVADSEYLAVQFDADRKVSAVVLASDPQNDIAVLRVNLAAFPGAVVAPLRRTDSHAALAEGDRVFTIGSPLDLEKVLTTGVVSKIDTHAIISDINVNPGNSGGPLFTANGEAVGITAYREQASGGPGITGISRIEDALPLLEKARGKIPGAAAPAATLLPVEPKSPYPSEALKEFLSNKKPRMQPYKAGAGDYEVFLWTPPISFLAEEADAIDMQHKKDKHAKKNTEEPVLPSLPPGWEKVAARIKPVLEIVVKPKLKEGFWSKLGRSYRESKGFYGGPANVHFKTDFYRMRLLCGEKEVQPIQPARTQVSGARNAALNITNVASIGDYFYAPDSISPDCGKVALEIYAGKETQQDTVVKVFEPEIIESIWGDFGAYRKAQAIKPANTP